MAQQIPFIERLRMAWRLLVDGEFAEKVAAWLDRAEEAKAEPESLPERVHASSLMLLAALQREGRLVDFLDQDAAGFTDEEVGAAARIVHAGCRKVVQQFLEFEPVVKGGEGSPLSVPVGFDAERIRLTGNVTGKPPFRGILKHHGWVATRVRLPAISESLDPRVIAPAEVELP